MSPLNLRGPILSKSGGGGRGRSNVDVDPVLAAILGVVIVGGGGLAAYGASQDTEPEPQPAPIVQTNDPVVERALSIVQRADGTVGAGEGVSAAEQRRMDRRAARASAKGAGVDPFPAIESATAAVAGVSAAATPGAASGSAAPTPAEQARAAAAASEASTAATQKATGGSSSASASSGGSSSAGGSGASGSRPSSSPARRPNAARPTQVSLRIASMGRRRAKSRAKLGVLVPSANAAVARVITASPDGKRVTLRLKPGAYLSGKQSSGTKCVKRLNVGGGECQLVSVVTGRTAVIRDEDTARGNRGALTAVRVLSVWGGGKRLAGK